jgi:hypothetical protein
VIGDDCQAIRFGCDHTSGLPTYLDVIRLSLLMKAASDDHYQRSGIASPRLKIRDHWAYGRRKVVGIEEPL